METDKDRRQRKARTMNHFIDGATMKMALLFDIVRLKERYKTLSEVESLFGRRSRSTILKEVSKQMDITLDKIEELKKK